jgi:uncharacterized protein YndB with AHSA1/START domain
MTNLGLITEGHTLSFDCALPATTERTWSYLTQAEGLRAWLADGSLEPRLRGSVRLRFQTGEALVRPNSGVLIRGTVTRCEPYRSLGYSWMDGSREADASLSMKALPAASAVRFDLAGNGHHTTLCLTHTGLSAHALSRVGAGWHAHLNMLIAAMRDEIAISVPAPFAGLSPRYEPHMAMLRRDLPA